MLLLHNLLNDYTNFYINERLRLLVTGSRRPFYSITRLYCFMFLPNSRSVLLLCFWPFCIESNWISVRTSSMYFYFSRQANWLMPTTLLYPLQYVLSCTFFYAQTFINFTIFQLAPMLNTSSTFYFYSITFTINIRYTNPNKLDTWK